MFWTSWNNGSFLNRSPLTVFILYQMSLNLSSDCGCC
nr:MAG TPA: hypothetical protein [Caudoviricetes sp.]